MRNHLDFNGPKTGELAHGLADSNASMPGAVSAGSEGVEDQASGRPIQEHSLVISAAVALLGAAAGYYVGRRRRDRSAKIGHG